VPEQGRYPERRPFIDPDAWPLFAPGAVLAALFLWLGWWIPGGVLAVLAVFVIVFFRDPARDCNHRPGAIVSPAFGKVVSIAEVEEEEYQQRPVTRVSIFLRLWDVHMNYAPCDGTIEYAEYHEGKFGIAGFDKASNLNEHITVGLADGDEKLSLKIIAGMIARRIVMPLEVGAKVTAGEKIGMVKFGSRADVFIPSEYEITVEVGDRVKGAETVIATKR
jgi:phosphatidylserine decarboxylase